MQYSNLISIKRLRPSTSDRPQGDPTIETESDKARIIFSAPFRRLQKKAQVFPLEQNAAVRSRLTHSIEVATVGRQIAQRIIKAKPLENSDAFVNIIEAACLLHDIGNPPFGHFGESAISEWFKNNSLRKFKHYKKEHPDWYADLERFEGNAQGLRIITKLQSEDTYGLNLTCATLSAYLKYTYSQSEIIKNQKKKAEKPFAKKNGYFKSEEDQVRAVWEALGQKEHARHPLTFVMEAADDIAYCLSDIEDGLEKKIISLSELYEYLDEKLKEANQENPQALNEWNEIKEKAEAENLPTSKFIYIRTILINRASKLAADTYTDNEEKILKQEFQDSLLAKNSGIYRILEVIREFVSKNVYTAREAELLELTGNSAISGILEKFSPLLEMSSANFKSLFDSEKDASKLFPIEKRLLNLIPKQCKKLYKHETGQEKYNGLEWFLRTRLVIDYISGMTDDFALEIYQKLSGIKAK